MAILAECPACHRKQSLKNKFCKGTIEKGVPCKRNLDQAKRSGNVKYWINYRLPGGKQHWEAIGYSIEDARDSEGKRRAQKRENKLPFDIKPESKMTFDDLSKWYLNQETVKYLASYDIIKMKLKNFNEVFGRMVVADIKPIDLQNYVLKRQKKGLAAGTVDHDIGKVKTMIYMAFDNDIVGGKTIKTFRKIKKTLKKGSDVRDRVLSPGEFNALMKHSSGLTKQIVATGYFTGMRKGEILNLVWGKVKLDKRLIQLEPEDTKDREARDIPICDELYKIFRNMPNRIQKAGDDDHVFVYRGKPVSDVRKGLRDACKKAGIKYGRNVKGGFTFHDLRHTFNTNLRKAGVSESVIMKITGHSTREMFDRYNTVDKKDTKEAVKRLEVFLGNVNKTLTTDDAQPKNKNSKSS